MSIASRVIKLKQKRPIHKQRTFLTRGFVAIMGSLILLCGLPALIVFPELGIVFILIGLAALSLEFEWAFISLHYLAAKTDQLINWFKCLPHKVRLTIEGFFAVLLVYILYLLAK
jgi:uncharacterized protein (TIGR02611 family)